MTKTAKAITLALCAVIIVSAVCIAFRYQNTSPSRPSSKYVGGIKSVQSVSDKDHDGIDDQTDILQGALRYVETKPKYKSKYYATGYPNDGYGVCTDVVAFALRNAGYDLMELVQKDIAENPEDYSIETPDASIDFRRVRNLKVYFSNTAESLTTDISEIDEWQGGDIVIFEEHIGIVSDRRDEDGIPYIIHHESPWQERFEEDISRKRNDVIGHYRLSG